MHRFRDERKLSALLPGTQNHFAMLFICFDIYILAQANYTSYSF